MNERRNAASSRDTKVGRVRSLCVPESDRPLHQQLLQTVTAPGAAEQLHLPGRRAPADSWCIAECAYPLRRTNMPGRRLSSVHLEGLPAPEISLHQSGKRTEHCPQFLWQWQLRPATKERESDVVWNWNPQQFSGKEPAKTLASAGQQIHLG